MDGRKEASSADLRGGNSNHTCTGSGAGVARTQRILVTTTTKIVHISLYNNTTADDRVGTYQLDLSILNIYVCYSIFIYINISQVANHALFVIWCAVISSKRVEYAASGNKSLRKVTEDVDVQTVLSGKKALDSSVD
jgi:hypothetical protein